MAKQPIHSVRFGYIKVNIWFNQTKSGDRHNVTVTRLYRDGDLWRESQHFGRDDLLLLAKGAGPSPHMDHAARRRQRARVIIADDENSMVSNHRRVNCNSERYSSKCTVYRQA
jgi:hypothetical protein